MIKKRIYQAGITIGLRYNIESKEIAIGGMNSTADFCEHVVNIIYPVLTEKKMTMKKNKPGYIRWVGRLKKNKYLKVVKILRENELETESVRALNGVM